MKSRWIGRIAGLLVLAAALAGAYVFLTARPIAVTVVEPEENAVIRVFGLGTVEARIVSKVGFEVGGALVELAVDHGDAVKVLEGQHPGSRVLGVDTRIPFQRVAVSIASKNRGVPRLDPVVEFLFGPARELLDQPASSRMAEEW